MGSLVHISMYSEKAREGLHREKGLDTYAYSHLEAAHYEYLAEHHVQGQGAGGSQPRRRFSNVLHLFVCLRKCHTLPMAFLFYHHFQWLSLHVIDNYINHA